jgi:hypothetical protein
MVGDVVDGDHPVGQNQDDKNDQAEGEVAEKVHGDELRGEQSPQVSDKKRKYSDPQEGGRVPFTSLSA